MAVAGEVEGLEIPMEGEVVLGRGAPPLESIIQDPEVSRLHARVCREADDALRLEDLHSTNGTYLNGWRIPSPQLLSAGDRVQIGQTVFELRYPEAAQRTVPHRRPAIVTQATDAAPAIRSRQSSAPTAVLRAQGVAKSYGERQVLKGVDLEIEPGEIVGLLGPNGAGKTTFVSIVAGLRQADAGSVEVAGIDALNQSAQARKYLGIAPQDLGIYPTMSVRRNLTYFGELAGLRARKLTDRVEEVAEGLSLAPILDRPAGTLSGGQQRRLHTGMALLHHPPLLILDEPTVGADIRTRQEILDQVKKLAAEGRAVCYSTHYLPEIEELGASVAILDNGRIIAGGSIAQLVASHSETAVELHFEGEPPTLSLGDEVTRDGSMLRIRTAHPGEVAAHAVSQLGPDARRLRSVEIVRPSLDSVYLALTQRRYNSGVQEVPQQLAPGAAAEAGHASVVGAPASTLPSARSSTT